ncbi:barstar family protein [Streptomyces sp. NPDC059785]|uniref:barstar family protein n=1 Tax=unclassified Streptomyces TaxID=2593676 RepID=UPI00366521C2
MLAIDVSCVLSEDELHGLLKREFGFPSFYGRNWDAFWDAVSGLAIPDHVRFLGWASFLEHVPGGGRMLRRQLDNLRDEYRPDLRVEYV